MGISSSRTGLLAYSFCGGPRQSLQYLWGNRSATMAWNTVSPSQVSNVARQPQLTKTHDTERFSIEYDRPESGGGFPSRLSLLLGGFSQTTRGRNFTKVQLNRCKCLERNKKPFFFACAVPVCEAAHLWHVLGGYPVTRMCHVLVWDVLSLFIHRKCGVSEFLLYGVSIGYTSPEGGRFQSTYWHPRVRCLGLLGLADTPLREALWSWHGGA